MTTDFAAKLTETCEVRRNNGQNSYGPWLPITDDDLPAWVRDQIAGEIAENDADDGQVSEGGQIFVWRKRDRSISILRDGIWAGDGRIDRDGEITDCPAILGSDQDASDDTYEAIQDAIESGHGSVSRPDGEYTWHITD